MCASVVDESSCHLLIMLGHVHVLGDEFFSYRTDPMLLREIFQTPFSNNNIKKPKGKTSRPVAARATDKHYALRRKHW